MALRETLTSGDTDHIADHAALKAAYVARGATAGAVSDLTSDMSPSVFAATHRAVHNILHTEHNALGAATALPTTIVAGSTGHLTHQVALHKAHNLRETPPQAVTQNLYTTQTPTTANANDGQEVTVAARFTTTAAGTINGVRLYAATTPPVQLIGLLYSDTGTELARVTFGTITPGAWNEATFATPVAVTSGTQYRVAYWTTAPYVYSTGIYPLSNGNLNATGGYYIYGTTPTFPTNATASAFFADVLFAATGAQATVPGTPAAPSVSAGDAQATVSWVAPATGGSPITGYDIQQFVGATGGAVTSVAALLTTTITGLTNGTAYTFKVRAKNAVGNGAYSSASAPATPAVASTITHGSQLTSSNIGPEAAGYSSFTDVAQADATFNTSNTVVTGKRFMNTGALVNANNVTFRGCEFRHEQPDFFVAYVNGNNVTFENCRFRPLNTSTPPVTHAQSYQQGIKMNNGVGLTVKRCEFWGFGNAIEFGPGNSTQALPILVEDTYIHDAADQANDVYHHDGILSSDAVSYVTVRRCKIISGGNTNAIAFQTPAGVGTWSNISITDSIMGGFGYTVNIGDDRPSNNVTFTGNIFSTAIAARFGPFKNNWAGFTGTKVWSGNTWSSGGYWWPTDGNTNLNHATDFAG